MQRTVIRTLQAWDAAAGNAIQIQPGTLITSCRIYRNSIRDEFGEVYLVEFESTGRQYCCPLVHFQPRTEIADAGFVEEKPTRDTVAV